MNQPIWFITPTGAILATRYQIVVTSNYPHKGTCVRIEAEDGTVGENVQTFSIVSVPSEHADLLQPIINKMNERIAGGTGQPLDLREMILALASSTKGDDDGQ